MDRCRLAPCVARRLSAAYYAGGRGRCGRRFPGQQSGEPLAESVRRTGKRVGEHPEQGDTAFVFAMVFGLACLALYAWQRFGSAVRDRLGWTDDRLPVDDGLVLYAITVPLAVIAIWTMVVAGHSGATLVWKTNR